MRLEIYFTQFITKTRNEFMLKCDDKDQIYKLPFGPLQKPISPYTFFYRCVLKMKEFDWQIR